MLNLILKLVIAPEGWTPPFTGRSLTGAIDFMAVIAPFAERLDRCYYGIRKMPLAEIKPVFDLLGLVHKLDLGIDVVCELFAKHLLPKLASFTLVIGRFSYAVAAVTNYPFLFLIWIRLLILRLTAMNAVRSAVYLNEHLLDGREHFHGNLHVVHCHVERKSAYPDGIIIFERLGPSRCMLEVMFNREVGTGLGPTREFFQLFSGELVRNGTLWRVDQRNGLFPRPAADPHMFWIIGVLCAKAIAQECLLSLPIDPLFFDIVRGNIDEETCAKIDPDLMESLTDKSGLMHLQFVYPDKDAGEMIPGGADIDVTEENVEAFVTLVKETLICGHLAAAFKSGFENVISWDALNMFTPREILELLNGTAIPPFTMEELKASITPGQGYQEGSPQLNWLFCVLMELDEQQRI
jgi:E3 ubiquitin-protein ligase TRIP12